MSDDFDIEDAFARYKANERARGREPKTYGAWIQAGMPTPIEDED